MKKITKQEIRSIADITDRFEDKFGDIKGFEYVYADEGTHSAFEDDCFIHIVRNHARFVFYNGQGKGCFRDKDVKRFEKIVDGRLNG